MMQLDIVTVDLWIEARLTGACSRNCAYCRGNAPVILNNDKCAKDRVPDGAKSNPIWQCHSLEIEVDFNADSFRPHAELTK